MRTTKIICDGCGETNGDFTPLVVSLAEPGSYRYGRPDEEHPELLHLTDLCPICRCHIMAAITHALAERDKEKM